MKVKVERVTIPLPLSLDGKDAIRFTVEYKHRWWQRWKYIRDGSVPRLFESKEEIDEFMESAGFSRI